MAEPARSHPPIVSLDDWRQALGAFREKEKALTRELDALNAERRRLPMVEVDAGYVFDGISGHRTLLDLFDQRAQLIVYHFMFAPDATEGCPGCSWVVDAMSHPAHLQARDTSFVLVSRAELASLHKYRARMGWDFPWYSSFGTTFNEDMGATIDGQENHGASVFMRVDDRVYRTYFTEDRGVEHLGSHWSYLDLTPTGARNRGRTPHRVGLKKIPTIGSDATMPTDPDRPRGQYALKSTSASCLNRTRLS